MDGHRRLSGDRGAGYFGRDAGAEILARMLATEQGGFQADIVDRSIPRGAFESLGISEANLAAVRARLGEKLAEAQATLAA